MKISSRFRPRLIRAGSSSARSMSRIRARIAPLQRRELVKGRRFPTHSEPRIHQAERRGILLFQSGGIQKDGPPAPGLRNELLDLLRGHKLNDVTRPAVLR